MNLAARGQENGPESVHEPRRDTRQVSKLLPQLFGSLDPSRRMTVLDVGRALPETVTFFSSFRCKLYLLDLYSALQSGRIDRDSPPRILQRQFHDLFGFQPGTLLDLCFLWDFPHYLNEKQLRAFSSALRLNLHPATRAHGFGVHSAATVLLNREYGILDAQTLSVRHRAGEQMKHSPHPQSFMNEWLTSFTMTTGVLLPDGKIEMLMSTTAV